MIERIEQQYDLPTSRRDRDSLLCHTSNNSRDRQLMACLCRNLNSLASWRILENIQGCSDQTIARSNISRPSERKEGIEQQAEIRSRA